MTPAEQERAAEARKAIERTYRRYPKTMAYLAKAERGDHIKQGEG